MTKSEVAQTIVFGSFILYAIDSLLDKAQRNNVTTIRLKQCLFAKTSRAEHYHYVEMSNDAWSNVIEKFSDNNYRIAIFQFVETLGFEVEELMTKMYGNNFIQYVSSFSLKNTKDGTTKEILKETREVSKSLIQETRKIIFDKKEEL